MVQALKIPVTAKMRLGWDDENQNRTRIGARPGGCRVAAVFIHGRTREQGSFSGGVSLEGIRRVVAAARNIPVIGNGDVTTPRRPG